ncbi:MAG: dihydrofolate reductase [Dysgonamonadaceae bacterium]|jgi:dihydrofolate reductase|nr:dihydrofolate reductase [Dysgonamonadaceae bacterium]
MDISIIVAIGERNEIGRNNGLLCYLPADLKHFKELTSGHTIVMGRKTFESLPKGALPNRKNIVLTRSKNLSFDNCLIYSSLSEVIDNEIDSNEMFIIGGGELYRQALPLANKLYLTKIHAEFDDADVFFPEINYAEWEEVSREEHKADEKNLYDYTFLLLIKPL